MSKKNKQFVARSQTDYRQTHRQVTTYLAKCATDVRTKVAFVEFLQRGSTTRLSIRGRIPGESCPDEVEGFEWLHRLSQNLINGKDCGKLTITPNGNATEIVVTR